MKNVDFLDELGELALGSRLKRLSDRLLADAAQVYKNCGHDIQPKWFPLLALLWKHKQVSIVEAAEKLGLTQPAISQFIKELVGVGLVTSTPSPQDSRRKLIVLTEQGKLAIANMQRMWNAVDEAAKSLCDESGTAFYETVQNFEKALANKSLAQRTKEQLSYHVANPDVEFLAYSAELAPHFKSINAEWIEDMFVMEASDEEILNDPGRVVIEQGGKIYFAKHRTLEL